MIERNLKLEIAEEYSNFLSMQLNEAKELIKKLESFKNNPYAFDDQTINRIIDIYQKLKRRDSTDGKAAASYLEDPSSNPVVA